ASSAIARGLPWSRSPIHPAPMKIASHIAVLILFGVFQLAAWSYFLKLGNQPPPPAGSPAALFMGALVPTGYFTFVKALEIIGCLLVIIPKTRALGLLIIGPIVVNILCFHVFLMKGAGIFPM